MTMTDSSLWRCLRYPREQLRALDTRPPSWANLPYRLWTGLAVMTVGGSVLYGASLNLVIPQWRPAEGALALAACLGWCVFGPALVFLTQRSALTCAHACLVTLAYGGAVLVTMAGINALLGITSGQRIVNPIDVNLACLAFCSGVMTAALALQLQEVRVPIWKTLLAWMAILNGSGAAFYWLFQRLLSP